MEGAAAVGDPEGFGWQDACLCAFVVVLLLGTAWFAKDLPEVLRELWRLIGDWSAVHDVRRVVDARPWGLDMIFTIEQDGATTTRGNENAACCSFDPGPGGRKYEYGLSLWNGAVALSRRLAEQRASLAIGALADGRSVVVLGCGQALEAMAVRQLFPGLKTIVATDGSEDVLLQARENVRRNLGEEVQGLVLAELCWEDEEQIQAVLDLNGGAPYDVVLCADVTYLEDCRPLVSCILRLSHSKSQLWIAHEPRRRSTEPLEAALEKGFKSVERSTMTLTEAESGRPETVPILLWHCVGKAEA